MADIKLNRCCWAQGNDFLMIEYHDNEYGKRKYSDTGLLKKLCLECFQAGKREALKRSFYSFEPEKIARR